MRLLRAPRVEHVQRRGYRSTILPNQTMRWGECGPVGRTNGVREMLPDEQPRERMMRWGSAQLKTSELIAILLNTGTEGESVIKLSERILHEYGGLRGLTRLDLAELTAIHGVGPAKATR